MARKTLQEIDMQEQSDPAVKWSPDKTAIRLDYAWEWFSYHAKQRLTAFHFFLIIVGLLAAAYTNALDAKDDHLQAIICIIGAIISVAFLALDVRNEELVNDGRAELRKLERALDINIHRADYKGKDALGRDVKFSWFRTDPGWGGHDVIRTHHKHRLWLRVIEFGSAVIFAVGFFASLKG